MDSNSPNFNSLRRLLALKRHEQPPPGYFNRFSRDVMARIKAGETGVSFELPLWERLFGLFDIKPVFAGAFGMAVCALLISGVIASENMGKASSPSVATVGAANASLAVPSSELAVVSPEATPEISSTNPISLFDQLRNQSGIQTREAGYWTQVGN